MSRFTRHSTILRLRLVVACLFILPLLLMVGLAAAAVPQASQPSVPDGLLITEFYYNPPGLDKEREWIELANLGSRSLPLAGFGLGDEEQPGGGEGMLRFPEGSKIGAGQAVVIARTAVGFRALFGASPDYEITSTDTAVPDMIADNDWASGEFALANDGDEIILIDDQEKIVDALNYGDSVTYFAPSIPRVVSGQSIERVPAVCDTDSAVDWRPQQFPTPGDLQVEGRCLVAPDAIEMAPSGYRAIGVIQGQGDSSPLLNQVVSFRGIVTGIMEDQNASGVVYHTLFVQDVPGLEDGDNATSDAVAVFLGRQAPQYSIGDQIVVTGQVTEYFGLTEIDDSGLFIELEAPSQAPPDAVSFEIPQDAASSAAYLEAHEGMLVATTGLLPVWGPTHSGCGFVVGSTAAVKRPIRHSGSEANIPPMSVLSQSDVDCSDLPALKSGDFVAGIAGPLTYHFEQYKVVQQDSAKLRVQRAEPLQLSEPPQASANLFRIATLNLNNYLVPSPDEQAHSSDRPSVEETKIKQRKLAFAISHTLGCPELLGVQEVESEVLLLELADITAASCDFVYQVTHKESADGRGIDVALLSDPRRVSVERSELHQACAPLATGVLDSSIHCPAGEEPLFSRPPLEAALRVDDEPLTIIVNHFKSKRGGELETAPRRLAQARHVNDLVHNRLAIDPQAAVIVLGDFNDFNLSPVWQQLQAGGVLYDAMQKVPARERYSYIFDGLAQLVDGILVSPALVHRIENVTIAHVNADYPISLALDDSPSAIALQASDHDPVLLSLQSDSYSTVTTTATAQPLSATQTPIPSLPPTAVIAETTRSAPVAVRETPTTAVQPSAVIADVIEAPLTAQPAGRFMPQEESGLKQYGLVAGLAVLLAIAVGFWLGRRA